MFYSDYKKRFANFIKPLTFVCFLLFYSCLGATNKITKTQVKQTEVEQKAQNLVWKIFNPLSWGTAFAVAPNLFITNFHVVEGLVDSYFFTNDIKLSHASGKVLSFKQIIKVDSRIDLALIETHEETNHYLKIPNYFLDEDKSIQELLIIGYPEKKLTQIKQIGKVKQLKDIYMVPTNKSILEGSSGSPVFNTKGEFIGVVVYAVLNVLVVKKIKYVRDFIYQGLNSLHCLNINSYSCITQEMERLHLLAQQDFDALAQAKLAHMYRDGYAVEQQNNELAFYYAEQAAKQGVASAQYLLAQMYYNYDFRQNDTKAVFWFKQVAKQGYISAKKIIKDLLFANKEQAVYQGEAYHGDTPFHHAARNGQQHQVKKIIATKANPNLRDGVGDTPLYDAVARGHKNIVKILITAGANPNLTDGAGDSPLHKATQKGYKNIVELLIANRADLNVKNYFDNITPLHLAVKEGHKDIVEVLIANKADPNLSDDRDKTPLHYAVEIQDKDLVNNISVNIEGVKFNYVVKNKDILSDILDTFNKTQVDYVLQSELKHIIELLLAGGAKPNLRDDTDKTALDYVAEKGAKDIAELLIKKGANPNSNNVFGWIALHYAAQKGHKDIVELLIAKGSDLNKQNHFNNTALHLATKNGHKFVAEVLIASGADLNAQNRFGRTALHLAANRGDQHIAELLIANGADPYIISNYPPKTALQLATEAGHKSFVRFLHSKGIYK